MTEESLLQSALRRLTDAAGDAPLDADALDILRQPKETLKARLVIEMDNGRRAAFTGWRCRYDDALGPTKGGVRFHPAVSQDEVESLAFWMTVKCAVAGLPYGGGKGGIRVDPKSLSLNELERLTRAYARAFFSMIGPDRDIPGPDVGTNAAIMGWMADEYAALAGAPTPAVVTGKPPAAGGSEGREEATALGGFYLLQHAAGRLGLKGGERVAVQGLGNVGLRLARMLEEAGFCIVAVADSRTSLIAPAGLDLDALAAAKADGRPIAELAGGDVATAAPDAVIGADCDLLIPAALENAITDKTAHTVRARVVLEMANGPTSPAADAILRERGTLVVPDVLANVGGVVVSYFEWLQNRQGEHWSLDRVRDELRGRIETASDAVLDLADREGLTLRAAAYAHGIAKLSRSIAEQGTAATFAPAKKSSLQAR